MTEETYKENIEIAQSVITKLTILQVDAEIILNKMGVSGSEDIRQMAFKIRQARYYVNAFKDRLFPGGAEHTDSYRATMIAIAAQILVDNCDIMIDRGVFRTGVKHTARKMMDEMMRFVDNDLHSRAALEQYVQLVGWFESQFEVAFKVSMMEEEKQQAFFDGWLKLLDDANIKIEGL